MSVVVRTAAGAARRPVRVRTVSAPGAVWDSVVARAVADVGLGLARGPAAEGGSSASGHADRGGARRASEEDAQLFSGSARAVRHWHGRGHTRAMDGLGVDDRGGGPPGAAFEVGAGLFGQAVVHPVQGSAVVQAGSGVWPRGGQMCGGGRRGRGAGAGL